ncbi:hypothetical protein M758_3G226800, partial [Ceratodon purpureus]
MIQKLSSLCRRSKQMFTSATAINLHSDHLPFCQGPDAQNALKYAQYHHTGGSPPALQQTLNKNCRRITPLCDQCSPKTPQKTP